MKLESFSTIILATLAYSDQFQYPLTKNELWERLVNLELFLGEVLGIKKVDKKNTSLSREDFTKTLDVLVIKKKVIFDGKYYALAGSEGFFLIRKNRKKLSKNNLDQIDRLLNCVKKIAWIKAVGITGSQAMENITQKKDDVDFIIITAKNRLWLVRPIVILYSYLRGKKYLFWPFKPAKPRDKWCFNLWLDEGAMELGEGRKNFYTAYEIKQIKWLYESGETTANLYQKNSWVNDYLSNFRIKTDNEGESENNNLFFNLMNVLLFKVEYGYLIWKLSLPRENASANQAFLHMGAMKKRVYKKWKERMLSIL